MKTIIVHYIPLHIDLELIFIINECMNLVVLLTREIEICTANMDLVNGDILIQIQDEQDLEEAVIEVTALCEETNQDQHFVSFNLKGVKDGD